MSPGATFERVYNELKRMLAEGELPPGSPIEPALIGKQIASSITPIRDALHRLTGERLVEAPNHNGFRVPFPTEGGLRELYSWHVKLVSLATRDLGLSLVTANGALSEKDIADKFAGLFVDIALASNVTEHVRAVEHLNDRLARFRGVESDVIEGLEEEYQQLATHVSRGDRKDVVTLLERYRRRRIQAVPDLLVACRM